MPNVSKPTCFVSMTYGHRLIDWVYDTVKEVAEKRGFAAYRSDEQQNLARPVRDIVREEIDQSFMVAVEASGFSWFVGFELFHAIERKLCILLLLNLKKDLPGTRPDRSVQEVFPELWHIRYALPLPRDGNVAKLRADLDGRFLEALEHSAKWSRKIIGDALRAVKPSIPSTLIDPNVKVNGRRRRPSKADVLFRSWCATRRHSKPIAIVGPPGCGKTVLLSRFVKWLWQRHIAAPEHVGDLSPVPFLLTTATMPEECGADDLWNIIEKRAYEVEPGACVIDHPGLLKPYREAGLVYLLFDGLDEFGTRRRREAENLIAAFDELIKTGVNVILTCRKTFWEQQVQV